MRYFTLILGLWLGISLDAIASYRANHAWPVPQQPMATLVQSYALVFFYGEHCPYCLKFAPVLKQYAAATGMPVQAVTIGPITTNLFADSIPISPALVTQFFHSSAELVIPAVFILNLHNYHAYAVARGALTYTELEQRLQQLLPKILTHEQRL